jgi:hypothetical protein
MNHYDYEDLPRRGKPKKEVQWSDHHALVLQAIYWHYRKGRLCTDQSIWDAIVAARGSQAISQSGARTRRNELDVEFSLVYESQVKGKTEAGRTCASYRLTPDGIEKARKDLEAARQLRMVA